MEHDYDDTKRIQQIVDRDNCSYETAVRYIALRDEGYSQYQARLMAGLSDPSE